MAVRHRKETDESCLPPPWFKETVTLGLGTTGVRLGGESGVITLVHREAING